jgi:hypothetical protein
VEQDIHQYYETRYPGQVVVLGADLFNCSPSSLGSSFKQATGATYPLLLNASLATGGNIQTLYGERDHYVVINKQGIVRYQANDRWPYGNGYHLNEIRGCVDSLVTAVVGVGDAPRSGGFALRASPNPFSSRLGVQLVNPSGTSQPARVTVNDLAGRRVSTLLDGLAPPGISTLSWNGRDAGGRPVAPGLYLVRAELNGLATERRIVRVR